ncbi:MAG: helicase-related protein [Polyangia bacterium]
MRLKALGLLQRMALVAIHPDLDAGPLNKDGKPEWTWHNARQVTDPACPKLVKTVDSVMAKPECGHLIFCDNVPVHFWLKKLLVAAGFPEARIAIFNAETAPSPARRQALAEGFNGVPPVLDASNQIEQEGIPPQYDVVIANATAYEGIDLHVRTCQVYHIDLPWEPATLQQRNGRAVRQGNLQAVIKIVYLLSERSMDAVRFSMILGKLGWMKDILKSADRETNNPGAQAEMNPEELLLYLARDPEQARAAIEQQKKLLAEETKQRVRRQAWTSLRGLGTARSRSGACSMRRSGRRFIVRWTSCAGTWRRCRRRRGRGSSWWTWRRRGRRCSLGPTGRCRRAGRSDGRSWAWSSERCAARRLASASLATFAGTRSRRTSSRSPRPMQRSAG